MVAQFNATDSRDVGTRALENIWGIGVPGITTDARERIVAIINQIRDQYGPGSILKELLQNADDALATRFTLVALNGVVGAANPLLRAPGLLALNDGPINQTQLDGMTRASSSDKTGDVSKVGRFGLGQKSLFNLCDAFVALGWIGDPPVASYRIVNPYVDLGSDAGNPRSWEEFGSADEAALIAAAKDAGFGNRGVVIYVPLRSANLRPSPGNGFSKLEPDLATLIGGFADSDQLGFLASALRNVGDIEIRRLPDGTNISPAFNLWRAFSRLSPWFPIGRIVQAGTKRKLSPA